MADDEDPRVEIEAISVDDLAVLKAIAMYASITTVQAFATALMQQERHDVQCNLLDRLSSRAAEQAHLHAELGKFVLLLTRQGKKYTSMTIPEDFRQFLMMALQQEGIQPGHDKVIQELHLDPTSYGPAHERLCAILDGATPSHEEAPPPQPANAPAPVELPTVAKNWADEAAKPEPAEPVCNVPTPKGVM